MRPVKIYCMHCNSLIYKTPRDNEHLEELLKYPVGECSVCKLKMTLVTDEEVKQYLTELSREYPENDRI